MNYICKRVTNVKNSYPIEGNYLERNGYGNLNLDAQIKWAAILEKIRLYKPDYKTVLDVGGGYAATTFLLSRDAKITNVDIKYSGNWFCTECNGTIPGLKDYKLENIEFKEIDFLTESDKLPDNHYDVVIDGCAIIHFKPKEGQGVKNIGLLEGAKIIHKKLKDDGVYVVSSDMNNCQRPETQEWLDPLTYVNIVEKAGFKLIGETNLQIQPDSFNIGREYTFLTIGSLIFKKSC